MRPMAFKTQDKTSNPASLQGAPKSANTSCSEQVRKQKSYSSTLSKCEATALHDAQEKVLPKCLLNREPRHSCILVSYLNSLKHFEEAEKQKIFFEFFGCFRTAECDRLQKILKKQKLRPTFEKYNLSQRLLYQHFHLEPTLVGARIHDDLFYETENF